MIYGDKFQQAAKDDDGPSLDSDGILCMQFIVRALLFYGRSLDNKLLVALSDLGQKQASTTQTTNNAIMQRLDYVATHPSDGITY